MKLVDQAPSSLRFTRQQRLLTPRQFQDVFRRGRRQRLGAFEVITLRNDGQARLGLVIPKRSVRFAVRRNTIKRWAREAFRHRQSRLPAIDIVLRVHSPTVTHTDVDAALDRLCEAAL